MARLAGLIVTYEEVLRRVNEDMKILNSIWQRKHRWIGHVLRHNRLFHEIIEGRMTGKPTRGRRGIQMLYNWQMMMAMLHSNRQLRTQRGGDTERGCRRGLPALQQKTAAADDDDNDQQESCSMIGGIQLMWYRMQHNHMNL